MDELRERHLGASFGLDEPPPSRFIEDACQATIALLKRTTEIGG
jgi:hypothetical protein